MKNYLVVKRYLTMNHGLILTMGLFICFNAIATDIYRSRDSQGTITYSDKRPDGDYELISKSKKKTEQPSPESETTIPDIRDMDTVRATTNTIREEVNEIYLELFTADESTEGQVKVTFAIPKDGKVINCSEDESSMTRPGFNGQICEKIQGLDYGLVESDNPMSVSFTFTFKGAG